MRKNNIIVAIGVAFLGVFLACEQAPKPPETKAAAPAPPAMLTEADVAAVAGFSGIKMVPPGTTTGAKGDLNFAKDDSVLILIINLIGIDEFNEYKTQNEYIEGAVSDVGDEAMSAPKGDVQNVLFVRSGEQAVVFTSMIDASGDWVKPYFTIEQLVELAKKMLTNMADHQTSP